MVEEDTAMFTASDFIGNRRVPIINAEEVVEVVRKRLLCDLICPLVAALLPEGADLSGLHQVLEVACGQGLFVLDLAYAHPELEVAGIESAASLIADANAQACDQQLPNASLGVVDLTCPPFDFSDASFDLVTASFLCSRLEEAEFPPLLSESHRLLRPGGWLRLVECEAGWSSSAAIETLSGYYAQAIARAGLRPIPANRMHDLDGKGALRQMLKAAGFQVRAAHRHRLSFSADEEAYAAMRQVISVFLDLIQPFVLRMGVVSEEAYRELVRQAGCEMRLPFFEGHWHLLTLWGQKGQAREPEAQAVAVGKQEGGVHGESVTG
jgi:ubiquinone/menaquinone biosynthesis C-methylase UbiE